MCAQEKVPTNSYEYALGGIRIHELTHTTRLEDNLIRHRGDRMSVFCPVGSLVWLVGQAPAIALAWFGYGHARTTATRGYVRYTGWLLCSWYLSSPPVMGYRTCTGVRYRLQYLLDMISNKQ